MKKICIVFSIIFLTLNQFTYAIECQVQKKTDFQSIERVCNNVDDIICREVSKSERRGCKEEDHAIIHKNMSAQEVFKFAQGCFGSSVTSFKNFFTDFIPELLTAMWKVTKGIADITVNSFSTKEEDKGWWSKVKGMYESSVSVAVDVYEAARQNPGEFLSNLWDKIVESAGPLIASYDCLKPQVKVEKICGFVSGWVLPPAVLAKFLIQGSKFLKISIASSGVVYKTVQKLKLQKLIELSEVRPPLSLKQYQSYYEQYKRMGYSDEEFESLYKTGELLSTKLSDLKPKPKINSPVTSSKKQLSLSERKAVRESMSHDYVSVEIKDMTGKKSLVPAYVSERIVENMQTSKYRLSYVDPKSGLISEMELTVEMLSQMKVSPGNSFVVEAFEKAAAKDSKYKNRITELAQKFQNQKPEPVVMNIPAKEAKIEGLDVREISHEEFQNVKDGKATQAKGNSLDFYLDEEELAKAAKGKEELRKKIQSENEAYRRKKLLEAEKLKKLKSPNQAVVSSLKSNFVMVSRKNSMGVTTTMPMAIIKKFRDGGREKILVQIFDVTQREVRELKLTEDELKMMKPTESDSAAKTFKELPKKASSVPMN